MKSRSRLVWLGALALILAVPPLASGVVGDLGAASEESEQKQNDRLDRHSQRLSNHGRQLRGVEYGVSRVYNTGTGVLTLTTPDIPDRGGNQATASLSLPYTPAEDATLTLRGAIRSGERRNGVFIGGGGGAGVLTAICAPVGSNSCGGGVSAGETACAITGTYDSGTGVLTFVGVPRVPLNATAAPASNGVDIAKGTCELPGSARYMLHVTTSYVGDIHQP